MNVRLVTLSLCLLATLPAHAEKADRDKPMLVEAGKVSIDDAKKIQILEGDVVITKGSMVLKAERVIITEDRYGFQKGTAFSGKKGLAYFRQKREGKDEYVEGEAERIEYDSRTEKARLFNRAKVSSGGDQVSGHYIEYDAITENYLATNAPGSRQGAPAGRVRAVIQPKSDGQPSGGQ